jgi:hypothetical protein
MSLKISSLFHDQIVLVLCSFSCVYLFVLQACRDGFSKLRAQACGQDKHREIAPEGSVAHWCLIRARSVPGRCLEGNHHLCRNRRMSVTKSSLFRAQGRARRMSKSSRLQKSSDIPDEIFAFRCSSYPRAYYCARFRVYTFVVRWCLIRAQFVFGRCP